MTDSQTPEAIRRADTAELPELARVLAAAFADYPWTRWIVDPADHSRRLTELYEIYLDLARRFGEVWTADDAAGVAAWTWSENDARLADYMAAQGLDQRVAELSGSRSSNARVGEEALSPHSLPEPHWYLAAVGVLPERQNRGLGRELLAPVLKRCDEAGRSAALETSAPANVRLYRRLGFEVTTELELTNGPRVWVMRRPPRAAQ